MRYLLLLFILLLTGCSQNLPKPLIHTVVVTKIVEHKEKIPDQLLQMKSIPKVPKDISMQSDVANYVVDLYESSESCKRNLSLIKRWNSDRDN